jgi:hypothetical protein
MQIIYIKTWWHWSYNDEWYTPSSLQALTAATRVLKFPAASAVSTMFFIERITLLPDLAVTFDGPNATATHTRAYCY